MILEISRLFLKKLGHFEITTEINPKIAAEMDLSRFDVIVSDYEMPEMDGLQLLHVIRSKGINIPFILLTGRGNDTVMIRALSEGAASYLHKTANPRAMFTELAAVLHKEMELKNRGTSVYHPYPFQRDNLLFDHLPEPAFAVDNEGTVTAWNQAAIQMTGRSADDMIGVGWEQCSLAFGGEQRKMAVHTLLSGDASSLDGYEITLSSSTLIIGKRTSQTEDGVMKTFWEKSSLIIGADGRADGAVVIIRDLTMRRSIINQNKVMRDQLAAIADCMIEFGGNFKENIRSVLSTACRFCGAAMAGYVYSRNTRPDCVCIYCCDEHKGDKQEFRSFITGEIHERIDQNAPRWYTRQYSIGSEGSSRVILAFYEDEESSFCDSFIRLLIGAISAEERRHIAIEEKNQSEERYRMIFENAPVALFEEDYSGVYHRLLSDEDCMGFSHSWDDPDTINSLMNEVQLTSMNEASCRLLGTDEPSSQAMKILGSTEAAYSLFREACTCITTNKPTFSGHDRLILPDSQERNVYLNWTVPRQNDQYKSVLVSMVDITGQKQIEASLRLANKKLGTLTTLTRHDILNQMTALIGYLHLLNDKISDPEVIGWIRSCQKICRAITTIISFTKEYEQIGLFEPRWADLSDLIHTDDLKQGFLELEMDLDLPSISIYADAMFPQVIWNLIDNISRHSITATRVSITGYHNEGNYCLIVEDNGQGIADSLKEKIFERGYGSHTGLGLFLVREILSITGISIRECGKEGEGAKFLISIPADAWRDLNTTTKKLEKD